MAIFEQSEMQVVKPGEEVPIKLTFENIGQKLKDLIAEKLNAHEADGRILTCAEIHDLASACVELSKVCAPFGCMCSYDDPAKYEVNKDAWKHE